MQETGHGGSADGALVGLHPDDLGAVDAEAHVPTRQHNGILRGLIAHHALLLAILVEVCRLVVNSVNVIKIHNLVVV